MSLALARRLGGSAPWLDGLADRVQPALQRLLSEHASVQDALAGRWLGAPLHPSLTDVAVGSLTAAVVLDAAGPAERGLGDGPLVVAVAASLPTAVTGSADWAHLKGEERRIGTLHALGNATGLALNVASLCLRASGRRRAGRALSLTAFAVTAIAAHLGGQLAFGLGTRVNRTARAVSPGEFVDVLHASSVDDRELRRVELDGTAVLVARCAAGELCAISATCSHLGGPLDEGERHGDTVTCPWHGSRFDLRTGAVLSSPAVYAQPRYEVKEEAGRILLRGEGGEAG